MGDYLCVQAFQAIQHFCSTRGILMLDAHRFGPEYFEEDKLHFIPVVHQELGDMLAGLVERDLKGETEDSTAERSCATEDL